MTIFLTNINVANTSNNNLGKYGNKYGVTKYYYKVK